MNSQNIILLAIGLFVGLIVTVAAVDQYLLRKHPPSEVDGLIWRVESAFNRMKDLEAVLELTQHEAQEDTVRMLVRMVKGTTPVLSVRYLHPPHMKDELFTIDRDLLSHYRPQDQLIVVKRWVGFPLAAIGLAGFDLSALKADLAAGRVRVQVLQNVPGFSENLFPTPLVLPKTFTGRVFLPEISLSKGVDEPPLYNVGFARLAPASISGSLRGDYILEVRSAQTGELERMIWIERETFMIQKVVHYSAGQRASTIRVQRMTLDQGLTVDEVLALPRGIEIVRG